MYTSPHKMWPIRAGDSRICFLGQEIPQSRMVPAQRMPCVVAMLADSIAQSLDFGDEFVAREVSQIFVHGKDV